MSDDPTENFEGCSLVYVIISYPLNWLVLKWVFIPFYSSTWSGLEMGVGHDEATFLMFLSPLTLPIELLIIVSRLASGMLF